MQRHKESHDVRLSVLVDEEVAAQFLPMLPSAPVNLRGVPLSEHSDRIRETDILIADTSSLSLVGIGIAIALRTPVILISKPDLSVSTMDLPPCFYPGVKTVGSALEAAGEVRELSERLRSTAVALGLSLLLAKRR